MTRDIQSDYAKYKDGWLPDERARKLAEEVARLTIMHEVDRRLHSGECSECGWVGSMPDLVEHVKVCVKRARNAQERTECSCPTPAMAEDAKTLTDAYWPEPVPKRQPIGRDVLTVGIILAGWAIIGWLILR